MAIPTFVRLRCLGPSSSPGYSVDQRSQLKLQAEVTAGPNGLDGLDPGGVKHNLQVDLRAVVLLTRLQDGHPCMRNELAR
jgi:hypothetical protein